MTLATLLLLALPQQADHAADRAALLAGIDALEQVGVPGPVVVFGPDAFAVLTDAHGEALVAAARHGAGRVVAIGHSGYLAAAPDDASRARLLRNALHWAAGAPAGTAPPRATDVRAEDGFAGSQVVTWAGGDLPPATVEALRAFVAAGGGLVVGECPWGWQQLHPALTLREDAPTNRLLAPMGLAFGPTTLAGGPYEAAASTPDAAHAGTALRELAATASTVRLATLERALQSVPAADAIFLPALEKLLAGHSSFAAPTPLQPLSAADPVARLQVATWSRRWEDSPAGEITPAPGADVFPGAVPADAPRVGRPFVASALAPGWISTGLYAPAGELVTVRVRRGAARGWSLRIGPHTDSIAHHATWQRWPSVSRRFDLADPETSVASPFGGLIYLEAERSAVAPLHLVLDGVVDAPFFELERPGAAEGWAAERAAPAPWAEIAGRHLILTVPSAAIRALDDPARVAHFWDRVIESHYQLAARPLPERPERFVADVQISAGYMHSGYPIMTWLDVAQPSEGHPLGLVVDAARLEREGSWGHFHELGHNMQRADWTFDGTGEVTCNLFSLHAGEVVCGIAPWTNPWLQAQKAGGAAYLAGGADFAEWKRNPGVALLLYAQIQREFGWEPFRAAFADYEALPASARPRDDAEKRDQWLLRMSRATGRDLGPVFARWGVPLGAAARAEAAQLDKWEPSFQEFRARSSPPR